MGKLGQPGWGTQWDTGPSLAAYCGEGKGKANGQMSGRRKHGLSSVSLEDRDTCTDGVAVKNL